MSSLEYKVGDRVQLNKAGLKQVNKYIHGVITYITPGIHAGDGIKVKPDGEFLDGWTSFEFWEHETKPDEWVVQILGNPNKTSWEISITKQRDEMFKRSWGGFNKNKLLVSSSDASHTCLAPGLGNQMIKLATMEARKLNSKQDIYSTVKVFKFNI